MSPAKKHQRRSIFSRKPRARNRLPLSILILAGLLLLFSLIAPTRLLESFTPANVKVPAFTPTPTALPKPTSIHGGTIVFTCTRGDINQICSINADGSDYRQLTSGDKNSYYPAISPSGDLLIYATNIGDGFDFFSLSLAAGIGLAMTTPADQLTYYVGNAFSPSFSPDGQQVLFVNKTTSKRPELWVMDRSGKNAHAVYHPSGDVVGAAWAPTGTLAAIAMAVNSPSNYEIFQLDLERPASTLRQLTEGLTQIGGSIGWAPDGSSLLIFAGPLAAREIYRIDLSTLAISQLTYGGNNASATYSPDGRYVVFNSLRNDGQADLYIMRSDGHSMRRLTTNPEPDWQPQWGP
jgi:Tol biopolymer transport system component